MADKAAQKKDDVFFIDPFQNNGPDKDNKDEKKDPSGEQAARKNYIKPSYKIQATQPIAELSTNFARAFPVNPGQKSGGDELYALLFNRNFPANVEVLEMMRSMNGITTRVLDLGKYKLGDGEYFAAVLERPKGTSLRKFIQSGGRFTEKKLRKEIIYPLSEAFSELHANGMCFGNINLDNIYYDQNDAQVTLRESISEFCGFSQAPVFETLNRLACQPEAKGNHTPAADYFALGVLSVCLLTGEEPMNGLAREEVTVRRMKSGSIDCIAGDLISGKLHNFSTQVHQMVRGLLNDSDKDRWNEEAVMDWYREKEKGPSVSSRVHKETTTGFIFDGQEYLGRKHLVYDLHRNWGKAKTSLNLTELSRWVKLALKLPKVSDLIEGMRENNESSISDDKLARIIHLLDPDGPIRFQNFAISIWGLPSFIAMAFIESRKDYLQFIGKIFSFGLVEQWINMQDNPEDYSFSHLKWAPFKVAQYMHKLTLGFGMERCLYMLNPNLSCQSPVVAKNFTSDLNDMLLALDDMDKDMHERTDPLDRHGAAFIATRIDLSDDIKVKSVQRHPTLSRNPHITMLALLTVAQGEAHIRSLKGLTNWMRVRVAVIADEFHNARIRKDFLTVITKASRAGSLNELFKAVSDPMFARRDQAGFIEAKKQYRALSSQIGQLGKQSNIERVAYQYGLRISVMFAYFVAVATLLLIVIRAA